MNKEMVDLFKKKLVHYYVHLDKLGHKRGITSVSWPPSQFNLEMNVFCLKLQKYFPIVFRLILWVDFPIYLDRIWKSNKDLIDNRTKNIFIRTNELKEFVDESLIPIEKGGQRQCVPHIPPDVKPLNELKYTSFSRPVLEKFKKYHSELKEKFSL